MATILLVGVDLLMRTRLDGLLVGHRLVTSETVAEADLVVCDIGRVDTDEVATAHSNVPILGFTNHTDTPALRRAHASGFDRVIVKSALVERAADVVAELLAR